MKLLCSGELDLDLFLLLAKLMLVSWVGWRVNEAKSKPLGPNTGMGGKQDIPGRGGSETRDGKSD